MKIIALDFDGVICNSVNEMAVVSFNAAQKLFPPSVPAIKPHHYINEFSCLRPVITFGFESVLLCLCIINNTPKNDILTNFTWLADNLMKKMNVKKASLLKIFAEERDYFIKKNLDQWLNLHTYYPGILHTLDKIQNLDYPLFIITTKEKRFIHRLLKSQNIDISAMQIFGLGDGSKVDVLRQLTYRKEFQHIPFYFIEDRLQTLVDVAKYRDFDSISLFLADWGYNTKNEQKATQDHSRISLISLSKLNQTLGIQ